MHSGFRWIAITSVFLFLGIRDLFPQAATINGWRHPDFVYCSSEGGDSIIGASPSGKPFYIDGVSYLTAYALQRAGADGRAILYANRLSLGQHTIKYGSIGSNEVTVIVTIVSPPTVTLAPFSNVCRNAPAFSLFNADSSNVNPKTGRFSGPGIDVTGNFNPASLVPGVYNITYTVTVGSCSSSASRSITVLPVPAVNLNAFPPVCEGTGPFTLTQGIPAGGTYSGPGVIGNTFNPVATGVGSFPITYTYSNGTCTGTLVRNIVVSPLPTASFAGLGDQYCTSDIPVNLTGNPTGVTGRFSGPGITDFGNGTARFTPATSGLGLHQISYIYTTVSGCSDTSIQDVQVGTNVVIGGLNPTYCVNSADIPFSASPAGGNFTAISGLTDNGNGNAVFSPATAGAGDHVIQYTFTDSYGCINIQNFTVRVYALPVPSIQNLAASYCSNATPITITGNFAPSGTFSGPAITDNLNGTAQFNPAGLMAGQVYQITYSYQNPVSQCQASVVRPVMIHPVPVASISGNNSICYGDATSLAISLSGNGPFSYSYTDGLGVYSKSGATAPVDLIQVFPMDTTTYLLTQVTDNNGCQTTGTGSAIINVQPHVQITSQPLSVKGCQGSNLWMTVGATGVNITYQWEKDGVLIPGATHPTLAFSNVQPSDIGIYRCQVSGDCGNTITSNDALLELWSPVLITGSPSDAHVCEGDPVNMLVTATGSNLSYKWYKDNVALIDGSGISGAASSSLLLSSTLPNQAGSYHAVVTGTCGQEQSVPALLQIDRNIVLQSQPADVQICMGNNAVYNVSATGDHLQYQWQLNNMDMPGENTNTLALNNVSSADQGFYRCRVFSDCGNEVFSNAAYLTVIDPPVITTNPVSGNICEGNNIVFAVSATGTSVQYQWRKDGVVISDHVNLSGSTTPSLTISNVDGTEMGTYTCVVQNSCGSVTSTGAVLTIDTSLNIIAHPEDVHTCLNKNAFFTVAATGNNLSYQWFKNNILIAGAVNPVLVLNSVTGADEAIYTCRVSNTCGKSLMSEEATLIMDEDLQITAQPSDIESCAGDLAIYHIGASGSNLIYQWEYNSVPLNDFANVSGTNTNTLVIQKIEKSNAGVYNCLVTGSCGSQRSIPVSLVVNDTATITQQPENDTVCIGNNAEFRISSAGAKTYQWQKDETDIPGSNAQVLTLTNVDAADSGVYRCIVIGTCDTLYSDGALLKVMTPPQIAIQPIAVNACEGQQITLHSEATGSELTWQWMKNGNPVAISSDIKGVQTPTLAIDSVLTSHAGVYYALVHGYCAHIQTNPVLLQVAPAPVIVSQPVAVTVCENQPATFSVSVTGPVSYQWQKDQVDLPGMTSSALNLPNVTPANAGVYRCRITGSCGTIYSLGALLTVNTQTSITAQPQNLTICEGQQASLQVSATGTSLSFAWKHNGINLADNGIIQGSNTSTLIITPAGLAHAGLYTCEVTGTCGTLTSTASQLTVNETIQISRQPQSVTTCEGLSAAFDVTATGSGLSWQWQKNNVNIAGAVQPNFNIPAVAESDTGVYRCVIAGSCGSVFSEAARLIVETPPVIGTQPPAVINICEGNLLSAGITATGSNLNHQWFFNGNPLINGGTVSGASQPVIVINPVTSSDKGVYYSRISNSCTSLTSSGMQVWVNEPVTITGQPKNTSACIADDIYLSVTATGAVTSYQWTKTNVSIAGATGAVLSLNNIAMADTGIYQCQITSVCDNILSDAVRVYISEPPVITVQPAASLSQCEGSELMLNITATGSVNTYQWKRNGMNLVNDARISGSQSPNLRIAQLSLADEGTYTCEISGNCTTVTSSISSVDVRTSPAIIYHPANYNVLGGGNASFTVTASGDNLTWQWYFNNNPLADGGTISGAQSSQLQITGATAANVGSYYAVVTGSCGSITSNPANLNLLSSSIITTHPAGAIQCEGESALFFIETTGSGHTYQWTHNGINLNDGARISGAQQAGLNISGLVQSDAGSYQCLVDGTENSNTALLFVNRNTAIVNTTGAGSYCAGEPVVLTVQATGDSLEWQWEKDLSVISDNGILSGSQTAVLSINPSSIGLSGSYVCRVTGACGSTLSTSQQLIISDPPVITSNPKDTVICEGQTLSLKTEATGTGITWQWYYNGIALNNAGKYNGAHNHTLTISEISPAEQGAYTCVVSGNCSPAYSSPATVTVQKVATITSQPANIVTCENDAATFVVSASLSNVTYQWRRNGNPISDNAQINGSSTPVLTINQVTIADNGTYECLITGSCNTIASQPALLTVYSNTSIVTQPTGNVICEGQSQTLTIVANGSNLSYQWLRNGIPVAEGGKYSGSNTSSLFIANATIAESGSYQCRVSGSCGNLISNPAQLTVNEATLITLQPENKQTCQGFDISLSVFATGNNIYQWEHNGNPLADGGSVSGASTAVLLLSDITLAESGTYRCLINGTCNSTSSQSVNVDVLSAPSITVQPAGAAICSGNNVLLRTQATGDQLHYFWKHNQDTLSDGGNISGSGTGDLNIQLITSLQAGIYTCEVSNACGTVNSTNALMVVNETGVITRQPVSEQKCAGDAVAFYIETTGNNLVYQWMHDGVPMADVSDIAGSQTRNVSITNLSAINGGAYHCVITDGCGNTLLSDPAVLTVNQPINITAVPAGDTLCAGQSITFTVSATGSNLTYQWYKDGIIQNPGTGISGTNTPSLILNGLRLSMSGYYSCLITGPCGERLTATIPVKVYEPVQITGQPANKTLCTGENAVFSVNAIGDSLKYQWFKGLTPLSDGMNINGSNTSILLLSSITAGETGSYYCQVTGVCGSMNSQPAVLTVNGFPDAANAITGEAVVCQGTTGAVYYTSAIANADYYKWTLPPGITVTSGDSTRQIEVSFANYELGGPIQVAGVNGCGTGPASPMLMVQANPLPRAYAGESIGICATEGTLAAYDQGAPSTGVWNAINGPALIDQPTQLTTSVSNLRNGANYFSWTVTLNGCTVSDTVAIYNNQLVVDAGTDTSICNHIHQFNAVLPANGTASWSIIQGSGYNINRYNPSSMVSGLARGTNVFKWSVNNNGCISYDTVIITNNMPTDAEAGNDQFIQADNTNLNATDPSIGTGEWALLSGSAVISNTTAYNTLVTELGQGKNIFEWTTSFKGCVSRDTVIIENALMDSTDAGPNQVICSNSVKLKAKNPYPGYGEWSIRRGSATFADNSKFDTYAYNLAQGENVLIWTAYLNGTTSDSVIIINNLPSTANAGINNAVCADSFQLNANIPYIGTGAWSIVSGSGVFENQNSNTTMIRQMAQGNNNYKWTITNGTCTSSSIVSITNNQPSAADAGFDATTCEDTLVLTPSVPTFGTGEWSVYSGSGKFSGNLVYDLGRDDNRLIYTIRNAGCYTRDTITITSHKPTVARSGADQSVCTDTIVLSGNAPVTGSGTWSLQSGNALFDDIHAPGTMARNMGAGENIFRWTISYLECSSYDEVTVSNDFVLSNAGADRVICGDRINLEANDPGYSEGTWTIIGGATGANILNPDMPNSEVTNLAQGANVLRWTISKNSCMSYDEVIITNNNPTRAFAGEDIFLCVDETALRATPVTAGTGTWTILSGSGTFSDIHDPAAVISNLGIGNNVLRWTSENAGCISTDEVIVGNSLPLNVYSGLDQVLCKDSTVLYANPPAQGSGLWSVLSGSAGFADPLRYNTSVTKLGNGQNLLKWTVSTTGCSVSDTVSITNNLPSTAIAGSDFAVCNSTGTLSANTPQYGTGAWSLISGAANFMYPAQARTVVENLALGTNVFQWTITNQNCSSSDQIVVQNNSPTVADAGDNVEVCETTALLYANSPVVGTGYWMVMSGTGDFVDSLNFNTTVNGLNFGENTFRWTTKNGNCYTIDETIITNNLAAVYAGEDQVVYESTATLSGNNPEFGTGSWALVAGAGTIAIPGAFSTQAENLGAGLNTFSWSIVNGSCTATDQVVIHYKVMPRVGFSVDATEGCPGTTLHFINSTQYGTTYLWDLGDGSTSNDVNPSHTYYVADKYLVKLTAYGPDNRYVTADTIITIYQKPIAHFQYAPDTAFVNKPVRYYNDSYGNASQYIWDFGDNETSDEENPLHYYRNSGNYAITLIITTNYGCSDTTYQNIFVADDGVILFPNAFTPNLDGPNGGVYDENNRSNDVFHPYHENVSEFHMEIYSRWGVLLFETDDINIGWDGYYKGKLLAKDVYVWKASGKYISGSDFLKTGTLLLLIK